MELKLISMDGNPSYVDHSGGVSCQGSCRLDVPPGKYRLTLIEGDGQRHDRTLNIREPEAFGVGPPDSGARTTGLVLGIMGSVMVPVGLYMMVAGIDDSISTPEDPNGDAQFVLYGLMVFVTGAALAPVGWVMFGRSGKFSLDRSPLEEHRASTQPRLTLGLGPLPGGGLLGGALTF